MHTAFLLLGGNMGDRLQHLQLAVRLIEERCGDVIAISPVYETAAWGYTEQPAFLNQAVAVDTELAPEMLIRELLDIEQFSGRVRERKLGPRTIDIDILLIDDLVLESDALTVPHASLHLRRFALVPLAQIAAGRKHPLLHKTIAELLTDCPDTLPVNKIS